MNWKQFLNPDWRKIVLFIIIFIIANLPIQNLNYTKKWFGMGGCNFIYPIPEGLILDGSLYDFVCDAMGGSGWLLTHYFWFPISIKIGGIQTSPVPSFMISYFILNFSKFFITLPLTILYWYFLSCLIVWAYDEVKKK